MNVLKVYRSLTPEQKRIISEKQVDLHRPIPEILALLKPIAACDRVADKARTPLGCTMALSIVLAIVLVIIAGNTGSELLFIAGLAGGALVFIVSLSLFIWTKKVDCSDNIREFVVPVLTLLKEDIPREAPVHVKLDLRSPTATEKRESESPAYKRGAYYKIIDSIYVDRWMTFEALLDDGTKLKWRITDRIRERRKTKRNPRGKIKTKTKYKKKTDIDVELKMKSSVYAVKNATASDAKRSEVEVTRKVISDSLAPVPPAALIDLIAGVYRDARPAGKGA